MTHPARRRIDAANEITHGERIRAQIAELEEALASPEASVGTLKGTNLDPNRYDPRCWACRGRGETYRTGGGQGGGIGAGYVTCTVCNGDGIRPDANRCDDCDQPLADITAGLCDHCADLPRCRRCSLRLGYDGRPGELCDDCRHDQGREEGHR